MVNGNLDDRQVEENLNFIEKLMGQISSDDEYLAAILHNQKILTEAFAGPNTPVAGTSVGIPSGTAGLAVDSIAEGETGTVLFKVDGRTVLSDFRAGSEINPDEVVRVSDTDDKVYPLGNVDPSKLDFGRISTSNAAPSKYIYGDTDDNVQVLPGEEEQILEVEVGEPVGWFQTGTNDETYSLYKYKVDGELLLDEPLKKPLGLYNNMYEFPRPLKVTDKLEVSVKRTTDAPGPAEYFSNSVLM